MESNRFTVSVIVQSNCHISQFLHHMFNVSALLLDDTLKPVTPLTNIWRDHPNAVTVCPTQCFSWLIVVNCQR